MKPFRTLFTLALLAAGAADAQVFIDVDTSQPDINAAVRFLTQYLGEFKNRHVPDFHHYWRSSSGNKDKNPDDMVYSITTDGATYNFSNHPTIFFARPGKNYVQLKTLFSDADTDGHVRLWAITNHYVVLHDTGRSPYFMPQMDLRKDLFTTTKVRNITYHYPKTRPFNRAKADQLIEKMTAIERQWGFPPVQIDYYLADSWEELAQLRGLDYTFGMDDTNPSGVSFLEGHTIFCQGMGEDYLHEVLHQYFNPRYEKSPFNHGLVYYLGGGMGHDFNWMLHRTNEYLLHNPDANLGDFRDLQIKDRFVRIEYFIPGLICKMIDERDGITGLRRLLAYKTVEEAFEKEFSITRKEEWDPFLRKAFRKYDPVK